MRAFGRMTFREAELLHSSVRNGEIHLAGRGAGLFRQESELSKERFDHAVVPLVLGEATGPFRRQPGLSPMANDEPLGFERAEVGERRRSGETETRREVVQGRPAIGRSKGADGLEGFDLSPGESVERFHEPGNGRQANKIMPNY